MGRDPISRSKFIRLGGALGVGAASASLVAACGGEGNGDDGGGGGYGVSGEPDGEGGSNGSASGSSSIVRESDVEPGGAVEFQSDGEAAVLVHLENGDFVAYSAVCTHQGCEVAYSGEEGTLNCPCHNSVFDPAQGGEPRSGPAQQPLTEIPVEVQNGEVVRA